MNGTKADKIKIGEEYFFNRRNGTAFRGNLFFKLPNDFSFGGISGAAPILSKITPFFVTAYKAAAFGALLCYSYHINRSGGCIQI